MPDAITDRLPYGMNVDGAARCINAEPGTFDHECGKPASWIGADGGGFRGCFCEGCKATGYEAREMQTWVRVP